MDRGDHVETRGIKTEGLQWSLQAELTSNKEIATKFGVDESNGHHGLSTNYELLIAVSTHACICIHRTFKEHKHDRQPEVHEYMLSSV
jgi:hypothetical protein